MIKIIETVKKVAEQIALSYQDGRESYPLSPSGEDFKTMWGAVDETAADIGFQTEEFETQIEFLFLGRFDHEISLLISEQWKDELSL